MAKGKITVNEAYCKGCELCMTVCPKHIIKMDENTITAKGYHPAYVTDPEECTGCASCAIMCPDSAITVERF